MQDAHSVITHAAKGHVEDIARQMEVSLGRMYEILGKDNPYPKAKRLIRKIGHFNPDGVRLIKADMDSMFAEILGEGGAAEPTVAQVHKEAFEAIDAMLEGKSAAEQLKELRDLAAVVAQLIEGRELLITREGLHAVA